MTRILGITLAVGLACALSALAASGVAWPQGFLSDIGIINTALAQPVAAPVAVVPCEGWQCSVSPIVDMVAMGFGALVVGVVGWVGNRYLGIKIEGERRKAFQEAATNFAGLFLNKIGNSLAGRTFTTRDIRNAGGPEYVEKAVPEAVASFGLTGKDEDIAEKILAKLPQIANTNTPSEDRGGAAT